MLQPGQRIREMAAAKLQPLGFVYEGKPDRASWRFARETAQNRQYITFVKSFNTSRALRVDFSTSDDTFGIQASQLVPGRATESWWTYRDEQSLDQVIAELLEIAVQKGLPWMEQCGGPDLRPSVEMERRLLLNAPELAPAFAGEYGLDARDPDTLPRLEELVLAHKAGSTAVDWEFLLGVSAFLGALLMANLGGRWEWDDKYENACIQGMGGKETAQVEPLPWVTNFWNKPDVRYSLVRGYQRCVKMAH